MDLWPRSWSTSVHLRPCALATTGFLLSWRVWLWSQWVSYLLSWLAVLTLAIPWREMEFSRLAWHMDVAHMRLPIDTCWRSPLISGLVQLIWLVFRWLLWDLQRFCCLTPWMLLASWWNLSSGALDWRQVAVHMTSQIVTSWRWHLNYEVDWHPLFACRHLSLPSVLMFRQMVEVLY